MVSCYCGRESARDRRSESARCRRRSRRARLSSSARVARARVALGGLAPNSGRGRLDVIKPPLLSGGTSRTLPVRRILSIASLARASRSLVVCPRRAASPGTSLPRMRRTESRSGPVSGSAGLNRLGPRGATYHGSSCWRGLERRVENDSVETDSLDASAVRGDVAVTRCAGSASSGRVAADLAALSAERARARAGRIGREGSPAVGFRTGSRGVKNTTASVGGRRAVDEAKRARAWDSRMDTKRLPNETHVSTAATIAGQKPSRPPGDTLSLPYRSEYTQALTRLCWEPLPNSQPASHQTVNPAPWEVELLRCARGLTRRCTWQAAADCSLRSLLFDRLQVNFSVTLQRPGH